MARNVTRVWVGAAHAGMVVQTMASRRLAKIAEAMRETLSHCILFELKDPRVGFITLTRVEPAGDLRTAKVYVSIMGDEKAESRTLHALRHAAGFLQAKVADRLQTRYTPVLRFFVDESVKKSVEISRLIDRAVGEHRPQESAEPPDTDAASAADDEDPEDGTA